MLYAVPNHVFSRNFTIFENDRQVAWFDLAWFREAAKLVVENDEYQVYRENWMSGSYRLEKDGQYLATAQKPNPFHRTFHIQVDRDEYVLEAAHIFSRAFVLKNPSGIIGSIQPKHCFTRQADINLPDYFPLSIQTFFLFLTVILWRRQHNAAASGT